VLDIKAFINTLTFNKKQKLFLLLCQYNDFIIVNKYIDHCKEMYFGIETRHYNYKNNAYPNIFAGNINIFNILELNNEIYIECILLFMLVYYYIDISNEPQYTILKTNNLLNNIVFYCEHYTNYFTCCNSSRVTILNYENVIPYCVIRTVSNYTYIAECHDYPLCNKSSLLAKLIYIPILHIWYTVESNLIKQNQLKLINTINKKINSDSDSESDF